MKFNRKTALRLEIAALPIILAGITAPTAAWAQDTAPAAKACTDANNNSVCDDDEGTAIIVTGSHIERSTYNSPSPLTVVTRNDATAAGFNSSSELLQSTSVTAGARQIDNTFGGYIVSGGPGTNTLSLRSLGTARTLVLLNGRRLAPSGTSGSLLSADLNVLPNAIVDRIEVLKDGASSIYGSDAIAGVVNVITDKKVSGLTLDGGVSIPGIGEGTTRRLAVVGGYNGERLHVAGSIEVYDRNNLSYGAHSYLACQTEYIRSSPTTPFGSGDFIDPKTGKPKCYPTGFTGVDGVTVNTIGTSTRAGAAGGPGNAAIGSFSRFRANPQAAGSVPGWEGVNGGGSSGLGNRDTTNNRYFNKSLISPTTNYNAFLQASYDLHGLGDAQLYFEGLYTRRESAQDAFFQMIIDYPTGSPLIPAELAFSNQAPSDQTTLVGKNLGVRVFTSRNYTPHQEAQYIRLGGGLRGNLPFSNWKYDVYFGHSITDSRYILVQPITTRLMQAQDVVASGSGFVCRDTSNGCVAAPRLTGAVVNGEIPADYLAFVAPEVKGSTKFYETTISASASGTLFELPAGKVGLAVGAEYRRQRIDDQPPLEQQTGALYGYSTAGITQGTDSVYELFGELEVPILRDTPFFHDLTINGSARYTNYRSYGSGWTYKIGGVWTPIEAISFRATYGTSYRAPSLSEQFQAPTAGFLSNTVDPCYQYGNRAPTTTIYKNCLAAGIPTNYGDGLAGSPLGQNVRVLSTGGAGTGLAAETSKNLTIGVVLQPPLPSSLGHLEIAVDYFKIQVDNGVAQFGGSNIISSCYNDPAFTAGHVGGELCRLVTRESGTSTNPYRATVTNGYINISSNRVRGLDFNMRYEFPLFGNTMRFNAGATRYFEQASKIFTTSAFNDTNGQIYTPKWTGTFDATYKVGRQLSLYYGLNWVGEQDSYAALGEDPATSIYQFRTPDYFTHSASVTWKLNKFSFTAGVKNILDKEPPQISAYAYNRLGNSPLYSGFDFVGRTFFVNFSAKVF